MPYLEGRQYPKTPEKLMRSRFTAYSLGGYGDYLLATWHPLMTQGITSLELSKRDTLWTDLTIIHASQCGDNGYVEFIASFIESAFDHLPENHEKQQYREKSVFKRVKGKWLYVGVDVE